jgi:hypothetical protein
MNEDIGKPTTPRDRQVNNVEVSGWLFSPVEKKQSERTRSWYLSTKVLLGADLPLLYVTLWINEHVSQETVDTALGFNEGDEVVVTGELSPWTSQGRTYLGIKAYSIS